MTIFTEKEIVELISKFTNVPAHLVKRMSYQSNGLATQIDGDIQLYCADEQKIICKIQTKDFYEKLGANIDSDKSKGILGLWLDAPHRMKNHHKKEAQIYANINPVVKEYLPYFYGGHFDDDRSVIFIKYIEDEADSNASNEESAVDFLTSLHSLYYEDVELCRETGTYITTMRDYSDSKKVYLQLVECIKTNYAGVYDEYLHDAKIFAENIEDIYKEIVKYGRTLCHGDFAHVNMKRANGGQLQIYDWETSCYINPEYDVIALLVRSNGNLTDQHIISVLRRYYRNSIIRTDKTEFQKCLLINLHMQFWYGYAWILPMLIGKEIKSSNGLLPEMDNLIYLFQFLKRKDLSLLI